MSGQAGHRKRLVCVSARDLRAGKFSLEGHLDFFPADTFGGSDGRAASRKVTLELPGVEDRVQTDIPTHARTGKPLPRFRDQSWVRSFFRRHGTRPGDTVAIERLASHRYEITPFETKLDRDTASSFRIDGPPPGRGPTVIELFAGAGGMALGFKRAGFRTLLANEWDRAACDTIRENVTDRVLNCAIQEIEQFPEADVVAGGPPCQGFSNLGERVPNDPRNQLWRQFMRCVEEARPKVFVLENVPPLLRSAEFVELGKIAVGLGYAIEARVLNSADFGVPQARKRAIVIGSRIGRPTFPAPTHVDPSKRDLLSHRLPSWRTVRDAIGHLPLVPTGVNWHIGRNPTAMSMKRYRAIPPGGNRWNLPPDLMPDCWKRKVSGGTDLMGRLWWDRPSVTIRTEFYKPEKGRYLHPQAHRPITHLEASLLQGFPEDYRYIGSKIQVGVQIGNAVPPPLAEILAAHVAAMLSVKRSAASRRGA